MATTARRLTIVELEALPEEQPGDRHELIAGALVVTPVPIRKHQLISGNISFALELLVREHHLGRLYAVPTGVRLHPDTLLIPDICYVGRAKLPIIDPKVIDVAPDLVIEILSPGTRQRDLTLKRELYERFGVQEYWIVDPVRETVMVLALTGERYEPVPTGEEGQVRSRVLPELTLTLADIFANVS